MKLTKNQEKFVTSMGKNVLVSASAGSGKTSTMIEKLLHLIVNEKVNVKNLLVLTFTDAAASEMKQRLYLELSKKAGEISSELEKQQDNQELKDELATIYEALEDINFCDIGTFHSVFKRIITKYFYHLEIDPAFSLITTEQEILLNQAISNVFNNYILTKDETFFYLQTLFSKKRNDRALKENIFSLYQFSKEKINFSDWYTGVIKDSYNPNINQNSATVFLKNYYTNMLVSYEKGLQKLINVSDAFGFVTVHSYLSSVVGHINFIKQTKSVSEFLAVLKNVNFTNFNFPRKLNAEQEEFKQKAQATVKQIRNIFNSLQICFANYDEGSVVTLLKASGEIALMFLEIVKRVDKEYLTLKNAKSKLDFNDLQQYMLTLLNNEEVVAELKSDYDYIFVDEFQDVNEIQFAIVSKISKDNNLNFIGDIKQSIYEFRLASPTIFLNQMQKFQNSHLAEVVHFNENYRSSNNILCFINYIFNALITTDTIGIDYKNTSQLICGNADLLDFDKQNAEVNVKMLVINSDSDDDVEEENIQEEQQQSVEEPKLSGKEKEAEIVVKQIAQVVGKDFYNPKTKRVEKVNFKHIAVLTRDSGEFVNILIKTMEKYKIPCFSSSKTNLFNTNVIQVLFSFLKVLNNARDDFSLSTLLVSKFGNFSFNELSKIRLINNTKKATYYSCLKDYCEQGEDKEENFQKKVKQFFANLDHYRAMLSYRTVYETVSQMMIDFNLQEHFKSLPNGNLSEHFINEFLQLINSESFNYDINFCVSYLSELSKKENYTVNITSGDNAVTLLTMHKSKGLEWPVVILAHLGKSFNKREKHGDFIMSQEFGLGLALKDIATKTEIPTATQMACIIEKQSRELKEQIRLLYVALSRAKNYLFLVGTYKTSNLDKLIYKKPLQTGNFLELIFKSFSDSEIMGVRNNLEKVIINKGEFGQCELSVLKDSDTETVNLNAFNKNQLVAVDENVVKKLKSNFDFVYDKPISIALKNSVSGLLGERDYEHFSETPKFLTTNELTDTGKSLEIGVAYHKIMQTLNYNESYEEIEEMIKSLFDSGIIEQDLEKHINIDKVFNAVKKVQGLILPGTKILKEKQFILSDSYCNLVKSEITQPVIIQGVIDLILINGKNAVVIDFKTNKTMDANFLKEHYKLQLELYAKAVESAFKTSPVKKILYSYELNDFILVN